MARPTFWTGCVLVLLVIHANTFACTVSGQPKYVEKDEFVHLQTLASLEQGSDYVRISAELVRAGYRLLIEELLDLTAWTQSIRFTYRDQDGSEMAESSYLIAQNNELKFVTSYGKNSCEMQKYPHAYNHQKSEASNHDWPLETPSTMDSIIRSMLHVGDESPYWSRFEVAGADSSEREVWVFGLAGMWMRARHLRNSDSGPAQLSSYVNNNPRPEMGRWRVDLISASQLDIFYYFNDSTDRDYDPSRPLARALRSMELRKKGSATSFDWITISDVQFYRQLTDTQLTSRLELPLGLACPSNPLLTDAVSIAADIETSNEIVANSRSQLIELEVVATTLDEGKTDVKNILIAKTEHPVNKAAIVTMFQVHDERLKTVRDFDARLRYKISLDADTFRSSSKDGDKCQIERLRVLDFGHKHAMDPLIVSFSNGVSMKLDELSLFDYILEARTMQSQRLLRITPIRNDVEQLMLETQVPLTYIHSLIELPASADAKIDNDKLAMSMVRTYERRTDESRRRGGLPTLKHVALILRDIERARDLAQVRINVVKRDLHLNYRKLAHIFDTSVCHDAQESRLELVASYDSSAELVDYAHRNPDAFIEAFYQAGASWTKRLSQLGDKLQGLTNIERRLELQKYRFGAAMNFMRVPRLRLTRQDATLVERDGETDDGQLLVQMTMIDTVSDIHRFDHLDDTTFEGSALNEHFVVDSAEDCAQFCRQFYCRMFAYNGDAHSCKLSAVSIDDMSSTGDDEDEDDDESSTGGHNLEESGSAPDTVVAISEKQSTLYYAPSREGAADSANPMNQLGLSEPSLEELIEYLEDTTNRAILEDTHDSSDKLQRPTRSLDDQLMSMSITKRPNNPYGRATTSLLVPTNIHLVHVPLSLDFAAEAKRARVAGAFQTRHKDQRYVLNALDDWAKTSHLVLTADERTYQVRQQQPKDDIYYTLRRLHSIELQDCELMCYNIDEWSSRGGRQVCISFSYCPVERQCVLAVSTDLLYVGSEIAYIEKSVAPPLQIQSLDKLLRADDHCFVARRNHLPAFEGPVGLQKVSADAYFDPNSPGEQGIKAALAKSGRSHVWLMTFRVEGSSKIDASLDRSQTSSSDDVDSCAEKCLDARKTGRRCLAFDYCRYKGPSVTDDSGKAYRNWSKSCYLFLINERSDGSKMSSSDDMSLVRRTLLNPLRDNKAKPDDKARECDRFVINHESEYRRLNSLSLTDVTKQALYQPRTTIHDINADECAFECSNLGRACLVFEFCMTKRNSRVPSMTRACNLFGVTRRFAQMKKDFGAGKTKTTEHNSECSVYLRNDVPKVDDLFNLTIGKSLESDTQWPMIAIFIVVYASLATAFILYLSKQLRYPKIAGNAVL